MAAKTGKADLFEQIMKEIAERRTAVTSASGTRTDQSPQPSSAPDCAICDDMGWVTRDVPVDHPDFGKAFPCRCQVDRLRIQREKNVRAMSALDSFADKTFETFNVTRPGLADEQSATLVRAYELTAKYAESPDGWMLLSGSYGSGKTHLAAAIANYRVSVHGEPAILVTTPDLLDHLRMTYAPTSEATYDEVFERLRNTPLLVIDDLGAESPTAWAKEKLYQLLNHRHTLRLPTVITTNLDIMLIDERIRSRLTDQSLTTTIPLDVADHRSPATALELDLTNLSRYYAMTFETFDTRRGENFPEDDQARFENAISVARAFAEQPMGWLVLIGKPGSGKTHIAAAIAHQRKAAGDSLVFVTCAELTDYLRSGFTPASPISFDRRLHEIKTARFAVIDNLTIDSHTSSWAREKLYDILIYRFDYNLPTVITTYQEVEKMDARLVSRIENKARCTVPMWRVPSYTGRTVRRAARPRGAG